MAFSILKRLTGDPTATELNRLKKVVAQINDLDSDTQNLSDEALKLKTAEFKGRHEGGESLDDLLPEAFAVVREAAHRVIGEKHFAVQLIGGAVLHKGKIAEMKTGEGKTLTSTLPIYLNALTGKGVHVVTVNEYLAQRDTEWMGQVYQFLGLSVGYIYHDQAKAEKQAAYAADITYGTNNEFGFDYLRDNMVGELEEMVQRGLNYAIVDEVDSILIDESRTPLIISMPSTQSGELYQKFAALMPKLEKSTHYTVDEKRRAAVLTDDGIAAMEKFLGITNIYEAGGIAQVHHLEQALQAHALFKRDKEYVVQDGEVVIVDEFTGRLMPGRRFSEGLHQAIEAKEGVAIKEESRTMATITFQNYFRLYEKLTGMTGTAVTEREEFHKIYSLDVVEIPTHRPTIRNDRNDLIYKTEEAKFRAIAADVKARHDQGQPVLLGTIAVEKSEMLSMHLKQAGVPHEILNAKNHGREAEIISQAGQKSGVTVSTNMAGRGTDIKLGDGVAELSGLHVIGSERHESRRIDNQLRGRAGRQGDPGSSQFYVSLDDDLMRIFAGDRIKTIMERLKVPEDQPIEAKLISKSLESAQKKVEGHNFDIRKHVVEYDDVMNQHREVIYARRRKLLEKADMKQDILDMFAQEIDLAMAAYAQGEDPADWQLGPIVEQLASIVSIDGDITPQLQEIRQRDELRQGLLDMLQRAYGVKEDEQGEESMRKLERAVMLRTIDMLWVEHLDTMEALREGIGLQGYGQRDPLIEYKARSFDIFEQLLGNIQAEVTRTIFKVTWVEQPPSEMEQAASNVNTAKAGDTGKGSRPKVGASAPGEDPIDTKPKQTKKAKKASRKATKKVSAAPTVAVKPEPAPAPDPEPQPASEAEPPQSEPEQPEPDPTPEPEVEPTQQKPAPQPPQPTADELAAHAEALAAAPIETKQEGSTTVSVRTRTSAPPPAVAHEKIGRNDPCPCGSGLKYKKCGLINAQQHQA